MKTFAVHYRKDKINTSSSGPSSMFLCPRGNDRVVIKERTVCLKACSEINQKKKGGGGLAKL